jgi:hypothetical protein
MCSEMLPQSAPCRAIVWWRGLPGDVRRRLLFFKHLASHRVHAPTARGCLAHSRNWYLHLETLAEKADADFAGEAHDEPRLLTADAEQRHR